MGLSIQLSRRISSFCRVADPSSAPPLGLFLHSSGVTTAPLGTTSLTPGTPSRGEGPQLPVCMEDTLLVQELQPPVQFTGNETGTNGAAICACADYSTAERNSKSVNTQQAWTHKDTHKVAAYLHSSEMRMKSSTVWLKFAFPPELLQ